MEKMLVGWLVGWLGSVTCDYLVQLVQSPSYGLDDAEFESRERQDIYLLQNNQDRLWGPPSPLFCGDWGSFPEVNKPGHDVDHSHHLPPPTVNNE